MVLEATRTMSEREAVSATGLSRTTVRKLREGDPAPIRARTERQMLEYLRREGLLPPEAMNPPRTLTEYRGSRAELAIQHFASPAVARALGWEPTDVVTAIFTYGTEQGFSDDDMARLRAWRDDEYLPRRPGTSNEGEV
ncbi:MAG TPA: hypothetical protein VFR37_02225 [Longimicrobium sp.]|nr:hypothetical protein [Longimicrobium sp.]